MAIQHNALTGADLHEPKGINTAGSGTVYKANGAGSGNWVKQLQIIPIGLVDGLLNFRAYLSVPLPIQIKTFSVTMRVASDPPVSATVVLRGAGGTALASAVFGTSDGVGDSKVVTLDTSIAPGETLYVEIDGTPPASLSFLSSVGVEI